MQYVPLFHSYKYANTPQCYVYMYIAFLVYPCQLLLYERVKCVSLVPELFFSRTLHFWYIYFHRTTFLTTT